MKVLRVIGGFFVKIWRWIKNTAWVQPLLIVGAIFGIIFSIPAISGAVQNAINSSNSSDTFYHSFQLSMEGGKDSKADELINNYFNYYEEYDNTGEVPSDIKPEEKKFFLMFTANGNSDAESAKEGFEVLRNEWNDKFAPKNQGEQFYLYTIFTDEETSQTKKNESAFAQFLDRHRSFIEQAIDVGENSNYCINQKISENELEALADCEPSEFKNPTIILVDWTQKVSEEDKNPGITQIFFNVNGEESYTKASLLYDCWNNRGDFGPGNDD